MNTPRSNLTQLQKPAKTSPLNLIELTQSLIESTCPKGYTNKTPLVAHEGALEALQGEGEMSLVCVYAYDGETAGLCTH